MIVYWCAALYDDSYFLNTKEPEPLIKTLKPRVNFLPEGENFLRCPSVINHIKNTFVLKSPIEFDIYFENGIIKIPQYGHGFGEKNIKVRHTDANNYFLSLNIAKYLFFCEEDLEMEFSGAYFSESSFSNLTTVIPGSVSISKWFRPTDLSFIVKKGVDKISLQESDDLAYVTFKTSKSIKLKKFYLTKNLVDTIKHVLHQKDYMVDKSVSTYLSRAYNYFEQSKIKKIILKHIKNNLME